MRRKVSLQCFKKKKYTNISQLLCRLLLCCQLHRCRMLGRWLLRRRILCHLFFGRRFLVRRFLVAGLLNRQLLVYPWEWRGPPSHALARASLAVFSFPISEVSSPRLVLGRGLFFSATCTVRAIWRTYTKAVREREVARGSAGYFDCRSEALAHLVVPVIFGLYSWNIHLRSSSRLYLWEDSRLVGSRRGKKRASVGDEPSGATNSPAPVPRGEPRPSAGSS